MKTRFEQNAVPKQKHGQRTVLRRIVNIILKFSRNALDEIKWFGENFFLIIRTFGRRYRCAPSKIYTPAMSSTRDCCTHSDGSASRYSEGSRRRPYTRSRLNEILYVFPPLAPARQYVIIKITVIYLFSPWHYETLYTLHFQAGDLHAIFEFANTLRNTRLSARSAVVFVCTINCI